MYLSVGCGLGGLVTKLCPTLAIPWTVACQAPLSMGFSRQEYWSGLPFPLQCMKVKSKTEVVQLCPTLSNLMDCSLPGSSIHGIFQARVLEWAARKLISFFKKNASYESQIWTMLFHLSTGSLRTSLVAEQ